MRALALIILAGSCTLVHDQPVSCIGDEQCSEGHYCETDVHICRECLNCKDLKRELPHGFASTCIKSVADCGNCFHGLVKDQRRDLNAECVPPDSTESGVSWLTWFIPVVLVAVGIILIAVIVIYVRMARKTDRVKIVTSTRTSLPSSCMNLPASAPPPPYNEYSPVRSESPFIMNNESSYTPNKHDYPLAGNFFPKHQMAGNQGAHVFQRPAYESEDHAPSHDHLNDNHEVYLEEETVESTWTPNGGNTIVDSPSPSPAEVVPSGSNAAETTDSTDLSASLAIARNTTLLDPPAKRVCVRRESGGGAGGAGGAGERGAAHARGNVIVNIMQINNANL